MQLFIVSGVSGAGKSPVITIFEDCRYFCGGKLPPGAITKFADV